MVGAQDLLIGLVLAAFFFGAKRLPEIARSLGQAVGEFRKGVSGDPSAESVPPAAPAGGRACVRCQAALEPGWAHCPQCGTSVCSDAPRGDLPGQGGPDGAGGSASR